MFDINSRKPRPRATAPVAACAAAASRHAPSSAPAGACGGRWIAPCARCGTSSPASTGTSSFGASHTAVAIIDRFRNSGVSAGAK